MVLDETHEHVDSSKEVIALLREIRNSLAAGQHLQDQRLERIEARLPDVVTRSGRNGGLNGSGDWRNEHNGLTVEQGGAVTVSGGNNEVFDADFDYVSVNLRTPLAEPDGAKHEPAESPEPPWQTPWQGDRSADRLRVEATFLETDASWRRWFIENMWLPSDPRLPLMFDIDHIKQCRDLKDVLAINRRLHAFNQVLCDNGGGFQVVDNIGPGNDKIWGNARPAWNTRTVYFFDGHMYLHKSRESETSSIEMDTRPRAPQRRLIVIDGLVDLRSKDVGDDRSLVSLENIFGPPQPTGIAHNVLGPHYLNSQPHFYRGDVSSDGRYRFCYSWFRIIERSRVRMTEPRVADRSLFRDSRRKGNILRAGHLYGSEGGVQMITRDSYLLDMVYSKQSDKSANDMFRSWTAVNLRMPFSRSSPSAPTATFHAQLQTLHQSNEALLWIEEDTRGIADHIDTLLGIGDNILMDPTAHDNLLFDDDTFSRSRRYWWVLNMLTSLRQCVSETLRVRLELHDAIIAPLMPTYGGSAVAWAGDTTELLRVDAALVRRLASLQSRLENQHRRAETLRSGLFNASGVVESRTSTRLGEIVRLLTYVSIFYLPLSFATSLWQTTPYFQGLGNASLAAAMLCTGAATYALVLNLNNVVSVCGAWYGRLRRPWLVRMQDPAEGSEGWARRAEGYGGFRHRRGQSRPSEWWVVWFAVSWPVRAVRRGLQRSVGSARAADPELDVYVREFFPSLPDMVRKTELRDGWMSPMPGETGGVRGSGETVSQKSAAGVSEPGVEVGGMEEAPSWRARMTRVGRKRLEKENA